MKKKEKNNSIIKFLNKLLMCTIIFLVFAIISKSNSTYKEKIKEYITHNNFNFSAIRNIYIKYLGGISTIKEEKSTQVFNEKLKYINIEPYEDGAKLEVNKNYLVPNQDSGIVIYVGEKDKYKNSIIVENDNGIDILYGNICNSNLKLYDTIDKNDYIGESCNNYIYMTYTKGEQVLDYKNYLS